MRCRARWTFLMGLHTGSQTGRPPRRVWLRDVAEEVFGWLIFRRWSQEGRGGCQPAGIRSNGRKVFVMEYKVGIKERYADDMQNIRFIKSQQWRITYFLNIIYAAIFGFFNIEFHGSIEHNILWKVGATLYPATSIYIGCFFMYRYQNWLAELRSSWKENKREWFDEQTLQYINSDEDFDIRFGKDWKISTPLLGIIGVNGAALILYLWTAH